MASATPCSARTRAAVVNAAAGFLISTAALLAPPAAAMQGDRLQANERIVIDGRLDEPAWERAVPFDDFWLVEPYDKVRPPVRTEMRIAYDHDAIYVGVRAFDPDPSKIRAYFARRDNLRGDQDLLGIYIDPLGTRKFAQFFRVNSLGSVADGAYNENTGNDDLSPDYEFEVASARFEGGWSAEFRIPFSSLRYGEPPSTHWSVILFRFYPRDERYLMASSELPKDQTCSLCLNQPLGLADIPDARHLALTPQVALRRTTDHGDGTIVTHSNDFVPSLDLKWRPRADTIVDATIHPDFSQVELDTPQLKGNTQFALFLPEKRPFFLEGADILESAYSAIYTRSVADPAWGARVTRRADDFDGAFLVARDDGGGSVLLPNTFSTDTATAPGKSMAVFARGRWQIGGATAGVLATDRTLDGGAYNRVIGPDVTWFPANEHRLGAQFLESWTTAQPDAAGILSRGALTRGHAAQVDWTFHDERWDEFLAYQDVGTAFRADNGFVAQNGFRHLADQTGRKFSAVGSFNQVTPYLDAELRTDPGGSTIFRKPNLGLRLGLPRGTTIAFEYRGDNRVMVTPGGGLLKRDQVWASITSNPTSWLARMHAELAYGDQIDVANDRVGRGGVANVTAALMLHPRLELEYSLDDNWIDAREPVAGPNRIISQRAQQVLANWHFSSRDTLRTIWQTGYIRRAPSLWQTPVAAREGSDTLSIVYGHRRGLTLTAYLGATFARSDVDGVRQYHLELFAKGSWTFDLL